MAEQPASGEPRREEEDETNAEAVEDLDVDEDAEKVVGGLSDEEGEPQVEW